MPKVKRTVYEVHDPDTIKIKRSINDSNFVRIQGFDGPERGEPGFEKAKRDLRDVLAGKNLTINTVAMNQGRVIAKVKAGRTDVTKAMKRKGY